MTLLTYDKGRYEQPNKAKSKCSLKQPRSATLKPNKWSLYTNQITVTGKEHSKIIHTKQFTKGLNVEVLIVNDIFIVSGI